MGSSGGGMGEQLMMMEERRKRERELQEERAQNERDDIQGSLTARSLIDRLLLNFGSMDAPEVSRAGARALEQEFEVDQTDRAAAAENQMLGNRASGRQGDSVSFVGTNFLGL